MWTEVENILWLDTSEIRTHSCIFMATLNRFTLYRIISTQLKWRHCRISVVTRTRPSSTLYVHWLARLFHVTRVNRINVQVYLSLITSCNVVICSCNGKCSDRAHSGLNAPDMKLSAPEDVAAVNCDLSSDSKCQHVSLCTRCLIPKLSRTVGHFRNIP